MNVLVFDPAMHVRGYFCTQSKNLFPFSSEDKTTGGGCEKGNKFLRGVVKKRRKRRKKGGDLVKPVKPTPIKNQGELLGKKKRNEMK